MKAPRTNDFAFGEEEADVYYVGPEDAMQGEGDDGIIDIDVSKTETYLRPTTGTNYTTYVSADTPNEERRRMIIRVTLFAVIFVPSVVLFYPNSEKYVLLGVMAFTFATNFAITLMSANLEEKATSLELKTDTLLDELNSAASTLRNFQVSLESIDLEQLKENVESARTDLQPLMERVSNPSLERIVSNVEDLMNYIEEVDLDKIDVMLKAYKKGHVIQPIIAVPENESWDILEEFPVGVEIDILDDDFYPSDEKPPLEEDDDMFFP